jgi:5-methylcytosine-specific restriction endonuclease McrA
MSNTRQWRAKRRTSKPSSRQKRYGLFLDAHPVCQECWSAPSKHAHHMLDRTFNGRNHWSALRALCEPCHTRWHRPINVTVTYQGRAMTIQFDAHRPLAVDAITGRRSTPYGAARE